MIEAPLAAQAVGVNPLDIASLTREELVDVLRQAANATAAGPDWYRARVRPNAKLWSTTILVQVDPPFLDSPHEMHCILRWQTVHTPIRAHGALTLRAVATAREPRPRAELRLSELRTRATHVRRGDAPRRREAALPFLAALAKCLEREFVITR